MSSGLAARGGGGPAGGRRGRSFELKLKGLDKKKLMLLKKKLMLIKKKLMLLKRGGMGGIGGLLRKRAIRRIKRELAGFIGIKLDLSGLCARTSFPYAPLSFT